MGSLCEVRRRSTVGAGWARLLERRQRSEPMSGRSMVRPPRTWHDMGLLAAGFGLVAISSAGVLAVGPRVTSHASFSGISVGVLISVVFGFGVATPTEQLISRRQNAGDFARGKSPAFWLGICASLTAFAVVFVVVATDAGHRYAPMTWSVLAVLGWYLVVTSPGGSVGPTTRPGVRPYDGHRRLCPIASGPFSSYPARRLGRAPGAFHRLANRRLCRLRTVSARSGHRLGHASAGPRFRACLLRCHRPGVPGCSQPSADSTVVEGVRERQKLRRCFRRRQQLDAPTNHSGGVDHGFGAGRLSRAAGRRSVADFRRTLVRSGIACLALGLGGALFCGLTAGPATTLLYGSRITLPSHGTTYLAVSTVMAITCSWLSVPLMALRRPHTAAWIWTVGSLLVTLTLVLLPAKQLITVGLIGPLFVTTTLLAAAARHRFRHWSSDPSVA